MSASPPDTRATAELFAAGLPPERAADVDDPAVAAAIGELWARARAAYPALALPAAEFLRQVAARAGGQPVDARAVDALHAGDLYLAAACAAGDPAALAVFEAAYAAHMRAIAGRVVTGDSVDEACQVARHHLLLPREDAPPRIGEYAGRGELLGFLRVVVTRIALDLRRREQADDGDDALLDAPDPADDPELAYFKLLYRAELKQAFAEALAELPVRARALLRHHLVDRLSIDRVAALYRIHRATAARQIERARDDLVRRARAALRRRLQIDASELDSVLRLVRSEVDVSASRLLGVERKG